jgi:hypothetical protein
MPLTWLPYIGYAMQFVAALLAWAVARRRRFHRHFAYFVIAIAFSDAARGLLIRPVLMRMAIPDLPYSGSGRAMFHLDQALTMLPRVGLMLATWKMVRANVAAHLAGASMLAWVAICVNYPWLNGRAADGGTLQLAYLAVFLTCQLATWSAMLKMLSTRASALLPTQSLLIATAAADLALIVGPFAGTFSPIGGFQQALTSLCRRQQSLSTQPGLLVFVRLSARRRRRRCLVHADLFDLAQDNGSRRTARRRRRRG